MNNDFVISVHALERFQERFSDDWQSDDETGILIYEEVMDALEQGRFSSLAPIELANNDLDRWVPGKSQIAWVADKTRGYVLVEGYEGMTVATVLIGKSTQEARGKLYGKRR